MKTRQLLVLFSFFGLVLEGSSCNFGRDTGLSNVGSAAPLVLKIDVDRSWAPVGEPVQIRFTVINDGSQPMVLESKDMPVLDIHVVDVNSGQVFLSWATLNPDKALRHIEWKPGESKVLELMWVPPQEAFGHIVHIGGLLSKDLKIWQGVSVLFSVGYSHGP